MLSSTDSSLSSLSDELDESRTPSRLDFCIEDPGSSPTQRMDSACTCAHDSFPFAFINEEAFAVDVPLDHSCLLTADPPQAADSHTHDNADMSHAHPAPSTHTMGEIVIEPRAPTPVRPLSVQLRDDTPESTLPPRAAMQRLNYPHRGLSRSALLQQKTLWNSRHEEWRSRMEQRDTYKQVALGDDAYAGIAIPQPIAENPPPYARIPPSGLERDLADHPHKNHPQNVHSSIFPRVGDISALRDPYAVNIDRYFFRYPLWTLHKTLYIFNVHQRSAVPAPSPSVYDTTEPQSSMSLSTLSSYTSSTLAVDEERDSTAATDDSSAPRTPYSLESEATSSLHSPPSWSPFRDWELSWYARWELLIGLFQRDRVKCDTPDVPSELAAPLECKTAPTFRCGIGDKDDDDDEDDYGTLISSLSFGVDFDEECERAMAFCDREAKYSEMAS